MPGANSLLSPVDVDDAEELITNADVLLCQLEVPQAPTLRALKLFKGHGAWLQRWNFIVTNSIIGPTYFQVYQF